MTRIKFEDLPSTNTPRNAENLNKLNNVVISPTEPTTGEEVWIQKSNNLIPMNIETSTKNGVTFTNNGDGTFNLSGTATADTEFDAWFLLNQLDLISGKNYVMSLNEQPYMSVQLVLYNGYDDWLATPLLITGAETVKTGIVNIDANVVKIRLLVTVVSGTKYNSNNVKFQFEQGTTPTVWQPYVPKKIHTKNYNDVYEEFYDKEKHNKVNYSTAEQIIGTWIDGKPLYKKVFSLNGLPSSNTDLVNIEDLNISEVTKLYGVLKTTNNYAFPMPFTDSDSNYNVIFKTQTAIRGRGVVGTGGISKITIVIEYTKTTD